MSVSDTERIAPADLADAYRGTETDEALQQSQATHLGRTVEDPGGVIEDATELGRRHVEAGAPAAAFAATYEASVSTLVEEAFERLEHRLGADNEAVAAEIQHAESELRSALSATFEDMERGLEAYGARTASDAGAATGGAEPADELNVDDDELLDGIGVPVFMLDVERDEVAAWNTALEELTGRSAEEALGMEQVSEAFYPDGRRVKTLADKVAAAPESAHTEFDVERAGGERTLYRDEGTMTDRDGEHREIEFSAMPLYEGDELVAVVETVRDRTEDARRQRGIASLVEELGGTLSAMEAGELSARASFEDEYGVVDDSLIEVVDQVNAMAERFETSAEHVGQKADDLATEVENAAEAARVIDDRVDEQTDQLSEVATEMENFSASMQEVAASSDQVASAAEQAKASADSGLESSQGAREATDEVIEMSESLVETVTELESQMNEIEDVVEVIAEVADQTNLLALNANIEAARAGEAGSGFEVVADEVKQLANETREHTEEIAGRIEEIQSQANETVVAVEESNEQVKHAGNEIEDALVALEEIADAVEEAASGVTEVAEANDEQAANVEQVMATVDSVRDQTNDVESATDDIVAATEAQTDAIEELSTRVDAMRDGD
ncbi:methyl-accepting chemotaxis protein [Halorussus marinus]|uniref:methyl-accepting chemotaxis protein n=1 Tax=Halorussus marinus TaxID=2505976 RepID=UPI001FCEF0D0|nr:methyl-accepting chemotaxis protein [Halorussus marinus]